MLTCTLPRHEGGKICKMMSHMKYFAQNTLLNSLAVSIEPFYKF